ncbi:MAG: dTDP-4-dehydrorhamnose 3,5-epimerase [Candidatus Margulisbacteria bacterium]|nr:dTDP-4-dehydrorhamnose 3,5-epimerase [Candidatus Margulisiibacteriota bacterium]
MGQFIFNKTPLDGLLLIEAKAFADGRGFFMETYNKGDFERNHFYEQFIQDNLSWSHKGVVRGLHYQINPSPMGKLVFCLQGKIFDIGVDIRKKSPTFGKWYGEVLSGENKKMLYFPPGFAHGFLALEDDTYVHYKCTGLYSQENERAIIWNDPAINIKWPVEQVGGKVIVSDKDKAHPRLDQAETNF